MVALLGTGLLTVGGTAAGWFTGWYLTTPGRFPDGVLGGLLRGLANGLTIGLALTIARLLPFSAGTYLLWKLAMGFSYGGTVAIVFFMAVQHQHSPGFGLVLGTIVACLDYVVTAHELRKARDRVVDDYRSALERSGDGYW